MNPIVAHALYLLAAIAAITVMLIAGTAAGLWWCKGVFRAWDRLGAAICGGDGKHSISAYCGAALLTGGPLILIWISVPINWVFGAWHCEDAAKREGLA